jgi:hypothetical protein
MGEWSRKCSEHSPHSNAKLEFWRDELPRQPLQMTSFAGQDLNLQPSAYEARQTTGHREHQRLATLASLQIDLKARFGHSRSQLVTISPDLTRSLSVRSVAGYRVFISPGFEPALA